MAPCCRQRRRQARRLAEIVCMALLCLGAACHGRAGAAELPGLGGTDFRLNVTSMKQARSMTTMLQQFDFSCGSAAIATLLTHHYAHRVDERVVFEDMWARGDQAKIQKEGFSLLDMKLFLEARGFQADGFEQPLDKLAEAGIPAIVLISENGYHHFVVVKGLAAGRVLIGDPANGTRAMQRAEFETKWKNRILFVIHNHQKTARFNLAAEWRVAPGAPLADGASRSMSVVGLPKLSPGDF
jgi:predicted double-glycine peptidase